MSRVSHQAVRNLAPPVLILAAVRRGARRVERLSAGLALAWLWTVVHARYRRRSKAETAREYELMGTATREAYKRHYNERVPTIEEEFEVWGRYHQHRHEMRYGLVSEAVQAHLSDGSRVLDIGCGSALVADRLVDLPIHYLGLDYGGHHITYASKKYNDRRQRLSASFLNGAAEHLPLASGSVDVVVLSEVIEHLVRPELAVWEISRVLRPGGVLVLTTNNASQMPLVAPTTNPLAWIEQALGAYRRKLISRRPWIWPDAVDASLLPDGSPPVYLPHTWHIQDETRELLAAAGLVVTTFSTFEFPPPESATAAFLERRGAAGRRVVDVIELVFRRIPLVNRLGCHLLLIALKEGDPVAQVPPPGLWPGPFSGIGA
jgi:ubiquinone/menaquinone biosynthesis C-methylase UbiE